MSEQKQGQSPQPQGGDDGKASKAPPSVTVGDILAQAKLERFADAFEKNGFKGTDSAVGLLMRPTDELEATIKAVGLKPGHRARLLRVKQMNEYRLKNDDGKQDDNTKTNEMLPPTQKKSTFMKNPAAPNTTNTAKEIPSEEVLTNLKAHVKALEAEDEKTVLEAVTGIRKCLSVERNPPIDSVISLGALPLIYKLMDSTNEQIVFEAAWAMTNVASGTTSHVRELLKLGAHKKLIERMQHSSQDVKSQAGWAVGNIAGDSYVHRDVMLKAGALDALLSVTQNRGEMKLSDLRNACWTVSNLCRGKPKPDFNVVRKALPFLRDTIYHQDDEVLTDSAWALSYLSDDTSGDNRQIQAIVESGMIRRLIELLTHRSNNVRVPVLRTIGNMVTGDDLQTQAILNCGFLSALPPLCQSDRKGIRKEAYWALSNVTAGNQNQIRSVIQAGLIPMTLYALQHAEFDVKKEAAWVISNATSGGSSQDVKLIATTGGLTSMVPLLKCSDSKMVNIALESVENFLRAESDGQGIANLLRSCGGDAHLKELAQSHSNMAQKAANIIARYSI